MGRPEMGEQSQWAAQPLPLCPGAEGWREAGVVEGQRGKRERWVGVSGLGSKEEEKGDAASFGVSQHHKNTQKAGGGAEGGHREKFKLSNGCGSLHKFMENPLFTLSGSVKLDP